MVFGTASLGPPRPPFPAACPLFLFLGVFRPKKRLYYRKAVNAPDV
jgi:hypothetical protein